MIYCMPTRPMFDPTSIMSRPFWFCAWADNGDNGAAVVPLFRTKTKLRSRFRSKDVPLLGSLVFPLMCSLWYGRSATRVASSSLSLSEFRFVSVSIFLRSVLCWLTHSLLDRRIYLLYVIKWRLYAVIPASFSSPTLIISVEPGNQDYLKIIETERLLILDYFNYLFQLTY